MKETADLACYLANLKTTNIPSNVFERCQELFLDWLASAYASKGLHPVDIFEKFSDLMGPKDGKSIILVSQKQHLRFCVICQCSLFSFSRAR